MCACTYIVFRLLPKKKKKNGRQIQNNNVATTIVRQNRNARDCHRERKRNCQWRRNIDRCHRHVLRGNRYTAPCVPNNTKTNIYTLRQSLLYEWVLFGCRSNTSITHIVLYFPLNSKNTSYPPLSRQHQNTRSLWICRIFAFTQRRPLIFLDFCQAQWL